MVVLRADPWAPDYGMGFDAAGADEAPMAVDPGVETADWSAPLPPGRQQACPVWFVDGVRRVELRLLADDGDRRAPGLFGSFAVGSVRCDDTAAFVDHEVRRKVVLGGGIRGGDVEVSTGGGPLRFEAVSEATIDPDGLLLRLQGLMRDREARLAADLGRREGCLVLVDGPLKFTYETASPVVGVVKRFARRYLGPAQEGLLGRLRPGERTPVFALGEEARPPHRYAWYCRLASFRPPWHDQAGLVRCEVRAGVGLEEGVRLAERVSALLPRFAGHAADPRTPQNLAPVAALESWLRHRMGDHAVVRRALLTALSTEGGAA